MAAKMEAPAHPPEVIGNAFLEQYYTILSQYPENAHKFYQNASVISRPAADGSMSSALTLEGISKMILSLDYKNSLVEILTADSQVSYGNGIVILVTGYFTGKDNLKRKFSQVFFLVPREANEYFVLNDVFRYVDEDKVAATLERDVIIDAAPVPPITQSGTADQTVNDPESTTLVEDATESVDTNHPLENAKISVAAEAVSTGIVDGKTQDVADSVPENSAETAAEPALDSAVSSNVEDAPKKSYASVANALNFKKQPFQQKPSSAKPVEKPKVAAPLPVITSPRPSSAEKNSRHIVKGHSIFVANLPMNATTEMLRETFEKFGTINPDGIQVRSYKQEKNCFGFVEFESAESMQSAVKVGSIMIGNRMAHIEEKKASNDGAKDPPPRRGGFRNDNFKGRGNFAGRGYGRNEGENQERYSGHPRSNGHGGGEGYYKNHQNGGGRAPRQFQEQDGKN